LQSTLLQLEYAKAVAREVDRVSEPTHHRMSHPPPPPRTPRHRVAEVLARLAWRLDREAALRIWL
jgi:hypothetical protein